MKRLSPCCSLLLVTALFSYLQMANSFALLQYVPSPRTLLLRIHNNSPKKSASVEKYNINGTEKKAIERFTTDYGKLCKTCPTRLQPRVDTLTEMIMGLSPQDRNELLEIVAKRMKQEQQKEKGQEKVANKTTSSLSQQQQQVSSVGLRTAKEVYNFQVTGSVGASTFKTTTQSSSLFQRPLLKSRLKLKSKRKANGKRDEIQLDYGKRYRKALAKMEEAKLKLRENDAKLVKIERLVHATTWLLSNSDESNNKNNQAWENMLNDNNMISSNNNNINNKDMARLHAMTRSQLKLQLLRLTEDRAKCERSRAKFRAKRYAASLELAHQER